MKLGKPYYWMVAYFALLCACTTTPVTKEVKVPVFTKCVVSIPAKPAFAALALPADASDGEKILAFARDTVQHFKYEGQLEAALAGCL